MKSIGKNFVELPDKAPLMVLPRAVLFPHALMPLFIFESRYRAMLAHALEQDRMFCIATMKPGISEAHSDEDFHPIAGLGLIRACVGREDGTSHLMLQGLARVRFEHFVQEKPFRIAQICELCAPKGDAAESEVLSAAVRAACAAVDLTDADLAEKLQEQIAGISDPGTLADLVAHAYLRDAEAQQEVLATLDLPARLRAVLRHLESQAS